MFHPECWRTGEAGRNNGQSLFPLIFQLNLFTICTVLSLRVGSPCVCGRVNHCSYSPLHSTVLVRKRDWTCSVVDICIIPDYDQTMMLVRRRGWWSPTAPSPPAPAPAAGSRRTYPPSGRTYSTIGSHIAVSARVGKHSDDVHIWFKFWSQDVP